MSIVDCQWVLLNIPMAEPRATTADKLPASLDRLAALAERG
jgi:hypothetical protein